MIPNSSEAHPLPTHQNINTRLRIGEETRPANSNRTTTTQTQPLIAAGRKATPVPYSPINVPGCIHRREGCVRVGSVARPVGEGDPEVGQDDGGGVSGREEWERGGGAGEEGDDERNVRVRRGDGVKVPPVEDGGVDGVDLGFGEGR
ncbi:hypothetical protein CNMCM5623_008813 [Aspergillus felis]|uniref:Uncharacterized protein n=1 Tax=Aspergillus felis TaxID=1287682 RepID=A0A8H6V457_9EURO|nr:hypothetical protein CNMCM5623_008813 [Aspergillus felis]